MNVAEEDKAGEYGRQSQPFASLARRGVVFSYVDFGSPGPLCLSA
jgi:hypothetical protein